MTSLTQPAPAILKPWPMRDKVAFAGIGTTRYGSFPENDPYGLGCEALNMALDDCGLRPSDVDGLIVSRIPSYERFAEMMGIDPRYCLLTETPGRFSAVSMALAAQAIHSGEAEVVGLALVVPLELVSSSRLPQAVSARARQPATMAMRAVFFTASS